MKAVFIAAIGIVFVFCLALWLGERISVDVVVGGNHVSVTILPPNESRRLSDSTSYVIRAGPAK